jgi:protein-S-isoprenylcysteine O-methyltransferase Ste14
MADDRDNPGFRFPPPLLYLLPLVLGIRLDRRLHVPFLPHQAARFLWWPLVGGGVALIGWFFQTMRAAGTTTRTDKPVSKLVQDGPLVYTRNPPSTSPWR